MVTNCHFAELIHVQAKKYLETTALQYRDYKLNKWIPVSWNSFSSTVRIVSNALIELGIQVQENIAVFSQNKPECLYVDFGAYGVRAVTIPFYATSSEAQVKYMVNDANIRYIFVGEQEQYDIAFRVFTQCPSLVKLIIFDHDVHKNAQDHISIYFDNFLNLGAGLQHQTEVVQRTSDATFDDLANILYTSGTTGDSKGVMLSHEMYHEGVRVNDLVLPLSEKDVFMNFLPFTHVFERAWSYLGLCEGVRLAINLRPADVLKSLNEVNPTCMCAVPRFWEKVYSGVIEKIATSSYVEQKMMRRALKVGRRYNIDFKSKGLNPPAALTLQYKFFEKTVIKLLKKTLGLENANFFPTAGAAVPSEVEAFIHSCGIMMVTGYGLTESTATVSCDLPGKPFSVGSVGHMVEGLEIRIGENDEILLRGKSITRGYYHKEAVTRQAIDEDGWFHTGDAGYFKGEELFLKERIKDLFKTSNGKYIAPQMIESKLVVDRFIDQLVVIADQRKFVSALIIPEYGLLETYARNHDISFSNNIELCANEQIHEMLTERISTLQQEFASYEQIKRFVLLPEPFSMARGELTNTLKIRRPIINEHFAKEIASMYQE
ncbi:MAG: long-chain fatty acid--CoA ligase [Bacteroidaceae bacterium]